MSQRFLQEEKPPNVLNLRQNFQEGTSDLESVTECSAEFIKCLLIQQLSKLSNLSRVSVDIVVSS